jgi:DNA repair protein RadC
MKEYFWILGLNTRNVIQYIDLVSLGTLGASLVHPRKVFRFVIMWVEMRALSFRTATRN